MSDLLRVEDLRIAFQLHDGQLEVVKGVNFRVRAGSVVALVGESGSGKSVIAQTIMGILPRAGAVTGGRILFNDPARNDAEPLDIAELPQDGALMQSLRGGRISMIFQEPMTSLSPLHTIGNQIEEALVIHHGGKRPQTRKTTEEMLGLVGFPDPHRAFDMYSFELSGGLRQRAMIAMALICRPALLIADEPTTALDVTVQAQVLGLLKELQQKFGMAMLLITHDLGVVANMADEVVVIYHGEIMEAGTLEDVYRSSRHPYLKALLAAVPHFDMKPGERLASLRDVAPDPEVLKRIGSVGSERSAKTSDATGEQSDVLLTVKGVSKTFTTRKGNFFGSRETKKVKAVNDVGFDIRRGECLGLVGESGCGKTTLSKILMRAVTPDSGEIIFNDRSGPIDLLALKGKTLDRFRPQMQMIFQDPFSSLSPRMTVLNILREPLIIHQVGDKASQVERVRELMRVVGLDPRFLNRYPHSFSGGQRQRIGIARALALNPKLLICDEPVSALDVSVQAQILNLLNDLQQALGLTYLFISHNLAVVDYMAERIAVMCRGRIVEIAPREILFRHPVHSYTRALLKAVPYPELDRPLDFELLQKISASDDDSWEPAFRSETPEGKDLEHIEVEDEHYVLARDNVDFGEIRP